MSILAKPSTTQLQNGLNKDFTFQKPGDVTYALNAIRDSHEGDKANYQSEPGNSQSYTIANGAEILGSIYGTDNKVYIFSLHNDISEIGVARGDNYTKLVETECLSFNLFFPITGEYRIRNGCDEVIYWSDGINPDRWFNVTKPELFQTASIWDCNKFSFSPDVDVPAIDLVQVNDSGGSLPLGSYYIQAELLDKNENLIYRTDISPQVVIYDESQSDGFNLIDGGLNIAQYDAAVGGVPVTNKSITFQFSNLDTSFAYLRINIARQINGTQVVDAHTVGQLIPITAAEMDWTYVGFNVNAGDFAIDYTSLLIDNLKYDSAYVMEQVEGRLLRANLKQTVRDYSNYQIQASAISAQWVSDVVSVADAFALGNPKNPSTYWYKTTFQGDEIQAFAIRYLHRDGSWSPPFHIPGRPPEATDLQLLTVVANGAVLGANDVWLSDIEHLPDSEFTVLTNDYLGSTIERWRVFNTATIVSNSGDMGYYETDTMYPDIRDCDDNLIWGDDTNDEPITTSTKIRHHRMPDRRLLTHYNGGYILPYGVQFGNIAYPSTDIVAHQFCQGSRDEFNKTVVDSGWAVNPPEAVGPPTPTLILDAGFYHSDGTTEYARYNSSELLFNKKLFNPDYLKTNRGFQLSSQPAQYPSQWAAYPVVSFGDDKTLTMNIYHLIYGDDTDLTRTNYKVNDQVYVPPGTYTGTANFGINIDKRDYLTADSMIELNFPLENLTSLLGSQRRGLEDVDPSQWILNNFYVYKKVNNKPFSNLFSIRYEYLNFNPTYSILTGDNILFNGDSIISLAAPFREKFVAGSEDDDIYEALSYLYMYEEHQINGSLRHGGDTDDTSYYKLNGNEHLLRKLGDLNENARYVIRIQADWRTEYYSYNKDYDVQTLEQTKSQLPFNYDYCSQCSGVYKTRIVWSPKSFDEENFDLYRINKTNDYIDLPGHRGEITGMVYKSGYLIVRTMETCFVLKPYPQTISTDQSTAYLTSGEFLSIPPEEIAQSDVGFAGMQSKQSEVNTPDALYWVDQKRGQAFRFHQKLEELSAPQFGLNQWFKENLPSAMDNEFLRVFNEHYPHINSTIATSALGVSMFYDPRFKRVFIHKKDYFPINLVDLEPTGSEVTYSFVEEQFLNPDDEGLRYWVADRFENRSFTLSFSVDYNSWTSFHSYLPYFVYSDENTYYTFNPDLNKQIAWRHLPKERYQNYFNTKRDFVVEYQVADMSTDTLDTVHYVGNTHEWDTDSKTFVPIDDITFDRLMAYNKYQNTGLLTLTPINQQTNPYGGLSLATNVKSVVRTEDNYKISELYDMAFTTPVTTTFWQFLSPTYPIDLVATNIDFTKSQYEWGNLSDKYIFVRLYFKPTGDYRKQVNLIQTNESYSIR